MELRADDSALSEITLILLGVIAIIVLVMILAGGITLVVALFFGGRYGVALFLFVLAGFALVLAILPQTRQFAKAAQYGVYAFAGLGLVFVLLGVLGR